MIWAKLWHDTGYLDIDLISGLDEDKVGFFHHETVEDDPLGTWGQPSLSTPGQSLDFASTMTLTTKPQLHLLGSPRMLSL